MSLEHFNLFISMYQIFPIDQSCVCIPKEILDEDDDDVDDDVMTRSQLPHLNLGRVTPTWAPVSRSAWTSGRGGPARVDFRWFDEGRSRCELRGGGKAVI